MLTDPMLLLSSLTAVGLGEAIALGVKAHNKEYWGQHTYGIAIGIWAGALLWLQ